MEFFVDDMKNLEQGGKKNLKKRSVYDHLLDGKVSGLHLWSFKLHIYSSNELNFDC